MSHGDSATDAIQRDMIRQAAARQSAYLMMRLMERFIPEACRREAQEAMMDAFFKEGMELTSIQQRLQMEEIRKTMLIGLNSPLHTTLVPYTEGKKE